MSKLYVFAIGGTGSRVLRSLTMLAAAGVNMGTNEIVPIIIDADKNNGDLIRTINLMNSYSFIRDGIDFQENKGNTFLETMIEKPSKLSIEGTDKTFKQFIDYGKSCVDGDDNPINRQNLAMISMLFSEANLEAKMDVGFKGNPNMGCVVLNQIASSKQFEDFANSFEKGDKIFIISSIFGGTGASGFPLLLKTLRDKNAKFPNVSLINEAQIGAVTILPYFKVEHSDESEIDSSTFISKACSALAYYENNVISDENAESQLVNALYYLADDGNTYENHDGKYMQQNPAHLIELLAATAAIHFMKKDFSEKGTKHYEYGVENLDVDGVVTFRKFGQETQRLLMKPMTQLTLMANCLQKDTPQYQFITSNTLAANKTICAKEDFYKSDYFDKLRIFLESYKEWLTELTNNKRKLHLFNLDCADKPFRLVTDNEPTKDGLFSKKDYAAFYHALNKASQNVRGNKPSSLFLDIFARATGQLTKEKLNM